jgi:hypothetical protein
MHMLALFSKVFVFTFLIRLANLLYRRNLRDENWTSKTNNLMSYYSCCCFMKLDRTTCPHYQMNMITSTNIIQMNRVHNHHSLKQLTANTFYQHYSNQHRKMKCIARLCAEVKSNIVRQFEKLVFRLME